MSSDWHVKLYYATLKLHALAIGVKEIPAPELDIKHMLEDQMIIIHNLIEHIKEGE
jgi:hypothetical protein